MAKRTKLWIAAAMKRLLVKKPLDKIRVTEICREAEIERPTFYYHFQDKYDLVAWIFFPGRRQHGHSLGGIRRGRHEQDATGDAVLSPGL